MIADQRVAHPSSPREAVAALTAHVGAAVIAGGTDLMVHVGRRASVPDAFVSLRGITGLSEVEVSGDHWVIGACTTMDALLRDESLPVALRQSARTAGPTQTRAHATIGGNLAVRRADQSIPPALIALQGTVLVAGPDGERTVTAAELASRGVSHGELILQVSIPRGRVSSTYLRVGPRNGPCYPTVAVSLAIDWASQSITIGVGGAGPFAFEAAEPGRQAAATLDWSAVSVPDDLANDIADQVARQADPITDVTATAEYRRQAVHVMTRRALVRTYEEGRHEHV